MKKDPYRNFDLMYLDGEWSDCLDSWFPLWEMMPLCMFQICFSVWASFWVPNRQKTKKKLKKSAKINQ
jgi:hypothetical protein